MPLAILEAQATGLPCIVSNISGNRSLVTDSVDGYLVELDDVNTLIDAICKINNKEIHENMSINCRKKKLLKVLILSNELKGSKHYMPMACN